MHFTKERIVSIKIKRIYQPEEQTDGTRILVDRLWPRGLSKEEAHVDEWLKELAPSDALRKWFAHRPERWKEFELRYRAELQTPMKQAFFRRLRSMGRKGTLTLLYAAKEEVYNNAQALSRMLREK